MCAASSPLAQRVFACVARSIKCLFLCNDMSLLPTCNSLCFSVFFC